jgi:hypothetical protein
MHINFGAQFPVSTIFSWRKAATSRRFSGKVVTTLHQSNIVVAMLIMAH